MTINKAKIKKILVVSLTNIGDVILTFPVIDILKENFPDAQLSVVIGPKGEGLVKGNQNFYKVHVFNKRQPFLASVKWVLELRKEYFDLVVDLRNSAIPFFISPRYRTSPIMKRSPHKHMRWQHLNRLKSICPNMKAAQDRYALMVSPEDKNAVDGIIKKSLGKNKFIVVAPGAADQNKQWTAEGFAEICDHFIDKHEVKIVFVGDVKDRKVVQAISKKMINPALNLSGKINLTQLAYLFQHSILVISNDSAPMHVASYLNIPILALFGPTDFCKYGPWSTKFHIIKGKGVCNACQQPKAGHKHTCMQSITSADVLNAVDITPEGVVFKGEKSS